MSAIQGRRLDRNRLIAASVQRWRRSVQVAALLAFLAFVVAAARSAGGGPLRWLFRADPLTELGASLASRSLLPGWPLALGFLLATLLLGRAWCAWLCPLGTLLDLLPAHRVRSGDAPIAERWRQVKWLLLAATLGMALLGSLTLLILDPLTLLTRAIAGALWPALNWTITGLERLLYAVPPLRPAVTGLDGALRSSILRLEPAAHLFNGLAALLLAATLLLNAVRRRFWCRYLCPLGGLLAVFSRYAWLRREVGDDACLNCKRCSRACPMGTIDPARGFASDPAECTLCLDCAPPCPPGATRFRGGWPRRPAPALAYDPSRRAVVTAVGAGLAGVALMRTGASSRQPHPDLLRPPGAADGAFLDRCIRCAACVQACPTGGLQPSLLAAGLEGFWTPVLIPRLGYCDYACNACGQVCPTGAIPPLILADKQRAVIGQASIDRDRCLPWTGDRPCVVCEEVCPVPEKAIWLEEAETVTAGGELLVLQLPHVDRARCIGCGICESLCPLSGPAAIRVHTPTPLA